MKHRLLTGVAVVAALAFSAPVWAQQANPSGGNSMGTPGPNPGGPGLTPYSSGPTQTDGSSGPRVALGGAFGHGSLGDAAVFDVRYQLGNVAELSSRTGALPPQKDGGVSSRDGGVSSR